MRKNKKLVLVLVALIILIGSAKAATLIQKLGPNYIEMNVSPGKNVIMEFINSVGYIFKNWVVEEGGVSIDTESSEINFTMPNNNVTIRAEYDTEEETTYTLTVEPNGGKWSDTNTSEVRTFTGAVGSTVTVPEINMKSESLTLTLDANGGTINGSDTYQITKAISRVETYYKDINGNFGSYDSSTRVFTFGEGNGTLTVGHYADFSGSEFMVPTRDGYEFTGWAFSSTGQPDSDQWENVIYGMTKDWKMYAVWKESACTHSFDTKYDETNHWQECSLCGAKENTVVHTLTQTYDATHHWNTCSGCSYISGKVAHISNGIWTDSGESGHVSSCTQCRNQMSEGHQISEEYSNDSDNHWNACSVCNAKFNNEAHTFDSNNICTTCGEQKQILSITDVPVGAYIAYAPSNPTVTVLGTDSGADIDQTFAISNYICGWKVFKNNSGQIDIISAESVGTLRLQGATGYTKAVYTLNKMCNDYVNLTYATSGRSLGYKDGSSMEIIDTNTYPLNVGVSGFPYIDNHDSGDEIIINTTVDGKYPLRQTIRDVWLASRSLGHNMNITKTYTYFSVCYLDTSGGEKDYVLYDTKDANGVASYGVRPIISLKSGLKIVGGDGTSTNPYVISN